MKLKFIQKHSSIEPFLTTEIPDFCVLTGVNGSGKSHLLEAIENRRVTIEGMEQAQIVYFNYENFRLENEPSFSAQQLSAEREAAWQYHNKHFKSQVSSWKNQLGENYAPVKQKAKEEKKSFWRVGGEKLKQYKQNFKTLLRNNSHKNNQHAHGIVSLAKSTPYSIDELDHDEFVERYKPFVFKKEFLPVQLGRVFWDYHVKHQTNEFRRFQNEKNNADYNVLNEEEFIIKHGNKPWEIANKILEAFDSLQYKFGSPEGYDYFGNYKLELMHTEKEGLKVEFDRLSSGERVLMALVASIYKASSDHNFPDILLLDEIDASLHPSMMQNMLSVIQDIFLPQNVKVILVTHSVTTIALAPEDSICVMHPSGQNRIEKKTQKEAFEILARGFATLEQGLKIFDQVARSELTIITEGRNTKYLEKFLELHNIQGVEILQGAEAKSGKNQLKVLFEFFAKAQPEKPVLFIFDCDVNFNLTETGNAFSIILTRNTENNIADHGIENLFSEDLFNGFTTSIMSSRGVETCKFDESRKKDLEVFILDRNNLADFEKFSSIREKITSIRET